MSRYRSRTPRRDSGLATPDRPKSKRKLTRSDFTLQVWVEGKNGRPGRWKSARKLGNRPRPFLKRFVSRDKVKFRWVAPSVLIQGTWHELLSQATAFIRPPTPDNIHRVHISIFAGPNHPLDFPTRCFGYLLATLLALLLAFAVSLFFFS